VSRVSAQIAKKSCSANVFTVFEVILAEKYCIVPLIRDKSNQLNIIDKERYN
jgi:hypothetical protein